jgi:ssDNA-binding Zn-finger/Zn-ribbon topoisomerase 1
MEGTMKNCPQCGTPLMRGWCPVCHPNQRQMRAYKTFMTGEAISQVGCLITLIVFVGIPLLVFLYFVLTS